MHLSRNKSGIIRGLIYAVFIGLGLLSDWGVIGVISNFVAFPLYAHPKG
jgi:hypothetical protein